MERGNLARDLLLPGRDLNVLGALSRGDGSWCFRYPQRYRYVRTCVAPEIIDPSSKKIYRF